MTVYIAICDNNIADRKHTERLLEREKDRRLHGSGDVLYIDSFGNEESLMNTPVKYDIFFIDCNDNASSSMDIAVKLRSRGISSPIVLFGSQIDYSSYTDSPEDIIYIEKPVSSGQIENLTDIALEWVSRKIPLIEVRGKSGTNFIKHDELVRAYPVDRYTVRLCLADKSSLEMNSDIKNLLRQLKPYGCFVRCKKEIVNILHVRSAEAKSLMLSNGDQVSYSWRDRSDIISTMAANMKKLSTK